MQIDKGRYGGSRPQRCNEIPPGKDTDKNAVRDSEKREERGPGKGMKLS